ncbi:MAG: response regulator, partial [Sedimentisphaerales bacterium]|nr:response regulator [Sedimentisphaerales bacterium]
MEENEKSVSLLKKPENEQSINDAAPERNSRILVIDDNESIHEDFRTILGRSGNVVDDTAEDEAAIFGTKPERREKQEFEIDSAFQGEEGIKKVQQAMDEGLPYAMAFVDIRMPPGWDGVETIKKIWQVDPNIQVAICTAYSDYSWEDLIKQLGKTDKLLILKKPFDNIEVHQIACALIEKWNINRETRLKQEKLENEVSGEHPIPVFNPADLNDMDLETARLLPEGIAKRFRLVVVGQDGGSVVVAMANPLDVVARDIVEQKLLQPLKVLKSTSDKINSAIELIYHGSDVEEQRLRDLVELDTTPYTNESDLLIEEEIAGDTNEADITDTVTGAEAASKAPVIRFVDLMLSQAVKSRASDIHIEPQDNSMNIRMRVDGILTEMVPPSRKMQSAVV